VRAVEMRDRTDEELLKMLADAQDSLFRKRLKNATHQLDKTNEISVGRREIARIKTILNERRNSLAAGNSEE
jgi:large subunit ribosomal protein L29